ncbi:MAG TPA: J domain-containing protein [Candidatus Limnocylindrales bacterium]|nr:J domain-containing protein [Candidatus Limnocylindrales bacterium]
MEYRDYYATLGVPRDASQADIKKAFRKLARKYHPDVNKGDAAAERHFKEVNEANAVLSDPEKRSLYDRLGADWEQIQRAQQAAGGRAGGAGDPFAGRGAPGGAGGYAGYAAYGAGPGVRFEFHGDPEDLAGFSDFFQTFFGANMAGAGAARSARGASAGSSGRGRTATASEAGGGIDLEAFLASLGFDGSAATSPSGSAGGSGSPGGATRGSTRGSTRRTTAPRTPPQHLEAQADISLEEAFHGSSRLVQVGDKRLEVSIPRGVTSGQRIRLSGKAGSGPGAGNVYLEISVRDHAVFAREGDDLRREIALSLSEAVLGAQVPVGTLKGRVLLTVPPGTQNGRVFRLAGQGMPHFKADGAGDLFVRVRVVLPTDIDEEGRRLFEVFADHVKQPDPRAAAATSREGRTSGAPPR